MTIHTTRPYPQRPLYAEPTDTVIHVDSLPEFPIDEPGPVLPSPSLDGPMQPLMPTTEAPRMPRYITVLAPPEGYMLCEVATACDKDIKACLMWPAIVSDIKTAQANS